GSINYVYHALKNTTTGSTFFHSFTLFYFRAVSCLFVVEKSIRTFHQFPLWGDTGLHLTSGRTHGCRPYGQAGW
ncbi:hypothetical protein, partial [Gimesia sp.]|uniref:hypothetical protein n=1 Tax=Gimesia sp. TaxID=2024833 RepID=UPI003A9333FA